MKKVILIIVILLIVILAGGIGYYFYQKDKELKYKSYNDCKNRNAQLKQKLSTGEPGSTYNATYANYEDCEKIKPNWLK